MASEAQGRVETVALQEQFDTEAQQKDASTLGMWIFLITEVMFFGGVFTLQVSQPLGFYWMIAAACMCGQASQAEAWERMQATNMHDAVLDQQEVAERFRGMRGDDF